MIAIEIEDPSWTAALPSAARLARSAARLALGRAGGDLTILLASDGALAALNARFRGKAAPTNVLAFPSPEGTGGHRGDVALAFGVCAQEASEQGKALADHLRHLVIHGVLHLLGYDHLKDDEAEHMESTERALLARLGIADPYGRA
ncbi:MAG: rRNA maturation RNase YbeY [Caulobacteraceae bacterium]